MRINRPAVWALAALLTAAPAALAGTAAAETVSATPSATATEGATAEPTPSATSSSSEAATPSASASAPPSATPAPSGTPSPAAPTPRPAPPSDPAVPEGARLSVTPASVPRLANVMVEGSCTQLAPIVWDEESDENFGEQWHVDITLRVDGKPINEPVLFATEYDGTFDYPVQIVGRDSATVPAPGDPVVLDAWCHEWDGKGKSFHLRANVDVTDATTCPGTLPAATGELVDDNGDRAYDSDGWQPDSDVTLCYFTAPDEMVRPAPPQRFGGDVADSDGRVSIPSIGPAVEPYDPAYHGDSATTDEADGEADEALVPRRFVSTADESADEVWAYTIAAIGTGADGSARVLTADATPRGEAAGSSLDLPDGGVATLPATGTDTWSLARTATALVLLGGLLVLVARRRSVKG